MTCRRFTFVLPLLLSLACFGGEGSPAKEPKAAKAVSASTAQQAQQAQPAAAERPTECVVPVAPPERSERSLTVREPPDKDTRTIPRRLRSHTLGPLSAKSARTWIGPSVPSFVPLYEDDAELHLLIDHDDEVVAFYRDMYGTSCGLSEPVNCNFFVRAWDRCGKALWARRLNDVMSRPDHLEVQDVQVAGGIVYFNEACQSYSKEADGKCSALVAMDPVRGEVAWRTKHLVSNGEFLVQGDYLIAGYGFTKEPDFLHIVRRTDGEVVHRTKLKSGHETLRVEEDSVLILQRYPSKEERFLLQGFDTDAPRLVRQK